MIDPLSALAGATALAVGALLYRQLLRATERSSAGQLYRHVRRQTVYREICRARLQIATRQPVGGDVLIIYEAATNHENYARLSEEFHDGRFVPIIGGRS